MSLRRLAFRFSDYPELIPKVRDLIFGVLVALLGLAIPRKRNLWLVGSWFGARFADNGKWFFLQSVQDQDVSVIFSTQSREVCAQLRERGYNAVEARSVRGVWSALRAGAYIYDSYPIDANFWAIRGALWVQMWHGVPLKRIERDIPDPQHWVVKMLKNLDAGRMRSRLRALLYDPWRLKKEQIACCTSDMLVPIFAGAFGLPPARVRVTGYPRNDVMWRAAEDWLEFGGSNADGILQSAVGGRRVLLYVPTFRDNTGGSGPPSVFEHTWNREQQLQLDQLLRRLNAVMLVKLHPHVATSWNFVEAAASIKFLPSALDAYPLLNKIDVLITDYSSIYFDYLLLEKPMIFYCYDLTEYQSSRGFYFDYDSVTPGPKARTFAELLSAIEATLQGTVDFSTEILRVKRLFHKFSDGQSSRRISMEIRTELQMS